MKLEKKHWIWIGVGITAITATGIFLYKRKKKLKLKAAQELEKSKEQNKIKEAGERVNSTPIEQLQHFPLKEGSKGYEVSVIQEYMNSTCKASLESSKLYPLGIDGNWDEKTTEAANVCASVKRKEIDLDMYNRIYRDMDAANILPEKEK